MFANTTSESILTLIAVFMSVGFFLFVLYWLGAWVRYYWRWAKWYKALKPEAVDIFGGVHGLDIAFQAALTCKKFVAGEHKERQIAFTVTYWPINDMTCIVDIFINDVRVDHCGMPKRMFIDFLMESKEQLSNLPSDLARVF